MTRYFARARRNAFFAGVLATGGLYVYAKNELLKATLLTSQTLPGPVLDLEKEGLAFPKIADVYQGPTDVYGPAKLKFKQTWNETIDSGSKQVIAFLSKWNL